MRPLARLGSLAKSGRLKPGTHRIETKSGIVLCRVSDTGAVAFSQPKGRVTPVASEHRAAILDALRITERDMLDLGIVNAATSRVKTLIPPCRPQSGTGLGARLCSRIARVCDAIGSTGLYPFACDWDDERTYHARQFPNSVGFDEDPATGVAASALLFGLKDYGLIGTRKTIRVRQGEAMGRPSRHRRDARRKRRDRRWLLDLG